MKRFVQEYFFTPSGLLALALLARPRGSARCDGMGGPVAKFARLVLASGNVNFALVWI
jgi:hypothetical protein